MSRYGYTVDILMCPAIVTLLMSTLTFMYLHDSITVNSQFGSFSHLSCICHYVVYLLHTMKSFSFLSRLGPKIMQNHAGEKHIDVGETMPLSPSHNTLDNDEKLLGGRFLVVVGEEFISHHAAVVLGWKMWGN